VRRRDWGNDQLRFFMDLTTEWESRVHSITAEGYFKLAIQKHPTEVVWSFAVEWNENYRIVGFFGETEELLRLKKRLPAMAMETIPGEGGNWVRYRLEVPLSDEDDILFLMPDEEDE